MTAKDNIGNEPDFQSKYNNLSEIKKTRLAYDNITVQLSKKNTRFQYKLIKKVQFEVIYGQKLNFIEFSLHKR